MHNLIFLILSFFLVASPSEKPQNVFEAAKSGTIADLRIFIEERGVDVNAVENEDKITPLHFAAAFNPDAEVVKYLIGQGADIHAVTRHYSTRYMAIMDDPDRTQWGQTPLHMAAGQNPNVEVTKTLVKQGADIRAATSDLRTPLLMAAAGNPNIEVLKYLVAQGLEIHIKDENELDILYLAAQKTPNAEVVKYLLEAVTDAGEADEDDIWRYLFVAAYWNPHAEVLEAVLEKSPDIHVRNDNGNTLLHDAAMNNSNLEIVKLLISRGADVNAKNDEGRTPLHEVIYRWRDDGDVLKIRAAKILLAAGADVNAKAKDGSTPLSDAAERDVSDDYLKTLIEAGADGETDTPADDESDEPDIFVAAINGSVDDLRVLIEQGADVNAEDDCGQTPLHFALYNYGDDEKDAIVVAGMVKILLDAGADVHARTCHGETPLHVAIGSGFGIEAVRLLLAHGADIEARDEDGRRPLHLAAHNDSDVEILKLLIAHGAKVNAKTGQGSTPLDYARTEEKKAVLRAAGAR